MTTARIWVCIYVLLVFISCGAATSCGRGSTTAVSGDTTAPAVPAGLAANAVSFDQITLYWSASTDNIAVTGYKIYRDGSYLKTVTGLSTNDSGLAASTNYCYKVSAVDAANNESAQSSQSCSTTLTHNVNDTTAPTTPTSLTATAASATQINLSWSASTDNIAVTGYKIYRGGSYLKTVTGITTSDPGLTAATNYCYTVTAIDAENNESPASVAACANTPAPPDTTAPSVPTGLTANASSPLQIDLSWTASTDNVGVTGYKIYRSGVYLKTVTGASTSDTGLTPSVNYCYTVSANDAANNESDQSAQACATTAAAAVVKVPDTGQTTKYSTAFGDDSDYLINPPSYTDTGNGTITDNVTGLMWQKQDDGTTRTWDAARTYCSGLNLGGYSSNWHLPTRMELLTIVNYGTYTPAIDATYFPSTQSSNYWSATTYSLGTTNAWVVYFTNGLTYYSYKASTSYVRCIH